MLYGITGRVCLSDEVVMGELLSAWWRWKFLQHDRMGIRQLQDFVDFVDCSWTTSYRHRTQLIP